MLVSVKHETVLYSESEKDVPELKLYLKRGYKLTLYEPSKSKKN